MIPQPHKWRKQVMLSMQPKERDALDELAELDRRVWGGKKNRSNTVVQLVKQELKRRREKAEEEKAQKAERRRSELGASISATDPQ
jgi:hypothetical protein